MVFGSLALSCTENMRPKPGIPLKTPLSDRLSPMTLTDVIPARWLVESALPPPQPAKIAAVAEASSASFHFMDFIFHLFV
jgi:hypothetical protein